MNRPGIITVVYDPELFAWVVMGSTGVTSAEEVRLHREANSGVTTPAVVVLRFYGLGWDYVGALPDARGGMVFRRGAP